MNILYIAQTNPLNISNGSYQRTHHLWNALKRIGNVYTAFLNGPFDHNIDDEENKIKSFVLIPKSWLGRHLWSFFSKLVSPSVFSFQSLTYINKQLPWKNIDFDYVVVRYLRQVSITKAYKIGPCFVDIDDLPSEAFDSISKNKHTKIIGLLLSQYVKMWQVNILKKCQGAWISNPQQKQYVNQYCKCLTLYNIAMLPSENYKIRGKQEFQIMTIGLMSYEPNYKGINNFLENEWMSLHLKYPNLKYAIAGSGLPQEYQKKWKEYPNVYILGYVKNIESLYEQSIAVITPIYSGAGTCIKVQEACLYGRKVFSTEFAVRGINKDIISELKIDCFSTKEDFIKKFTYWYENFSKNDEFINTISKKSKLYFNTLKFENTVKELLHINNKI